MSPLVADPVCGSGNNRSCLALVRRADRAILAAAAAAVELLTTGTNGVRDGLPALATLTCVPGAVCAEGLECTRAEHRGVARLTRLDGHTFSALIVVAASGGFTRLSGSAASLLSVQPSDAACAPVQLSAWSGWHMISSAKATRDATTVAACESESASNSDLSTVLMDRSSSASTKLRSNFEIQRYHWAKESISAHAHRTYRAGGTHQRIVARSTGAKPSAFVFAASFSGDHTGDHTRASRSKASMKPAFSMDARPRRRGGCAWVEWDPEWVPTRRAVHNDASYPGHNYYYVLQAF